MTFGEIAQTVYDLCGYPEPVTALVQSRVKRWINKGQTNILRMPGMENLRQGTLKFTSEVDRAIYGFPLAFEQVTSVVQVSNQWRLRYMTRDEFRFIDPGLTANGTPERYVPDGLHPRFRVPNETGIWVVSTSAADVLQMVTLRGVSANGDPSQIQTATLNGTTRVAIGTITDYSDIFSFDLSSAVSGAVSLYDAATAGHELARIPIGMTSAQFWCLRLWPTPSSALQYTVDGLLEIPDMIENTAVPMLPPSFHDLLGVYARRCEYERTNDSRFQAANAEWAQGLANLTMQINFPSDYRPVSGSSGLSGWSDLPGGWYPIDRWGWP